MALKTTCTLAVAALAFCVQAAIAECPLDHYFFYQVDGQLTLDKSRIYRHGDPIEGYYPLSWSSIYQRWSVGEPGFSDTTDPAYGFPTELELEGARGVDYQIWFEILDLSPDFKIYMNDGTWLDAIGERYNLSAWPEHHVHMKYCAYVPGSPAPDYPFYVTFQLMDDFGTYEATPPFSLVFNVPTPTVEATEPAYRGVLSSLTDAEITFTFHRPIAVVGGAPVAITDESETVDYTGYFDHQVSPDGMTLVLHQTSGTLPVQAWLRVALTEHVRDAVEDQSAVPFVQFVYTQLQGDLNCDGNINNFDIEPFVLALTDEAAYNAAYPDCDRNLADIDTNGTVNNFDIEPFVDLLTGK